MVVQFARAFTSHGWRQSVSNVVAQRTTLANVGHHLEEIIDRDRFRARVEELSRKGTLLPEEATIIREFLDAWRRHDRDPHDR
jgi:hypothetical protein